MLPSLCAEGNRFITVVEDPIFAIGLPVFPILWRMQSRSGCGRQSHIEGRLMSVTVVDTFAKCESPLTILLAAGLDHPRSLRNETARTPDVGTLDFIASQTASAMIICPVFLKGGAPSSLSTARWTQRIPIASLHPWKPQNRYTLERSRNCGIGANGEPTLLTLPVSFLEVIATKLRGLTTTLTIYC